MQQRSAKLLTTPQQTQEPHRQTVKDNDNKDDGDMRVQHARADRPVAAADLPAQYAKELANA